MNKLYTISIILICMLSMLTACSSAGSADETTTVETTSSTEAESSSTTEAETSAMTVDENIVDVDITIPASLFDEDSPATDELTQEQINNGFKSAVVNDDGSVTYTLSKSAFKEYKKKLKASTAEAFDTLNEEYSSIQSVEYNDDFSEINIYVDGDAYSEGWDFLCIATAGMGANTYQAYTNTDMNTTVKTIDADTGEVLNTGTYPSDD